MPHVRFGTILFVLVSLSVAGCSGDGKRIETAPVRGRITYHGKPVADAAVVFIRAGSPRFSSGRTDAEGQFQLTTFEAGDGAIVGENVITIIKRDSPPLAANGGVNPSTADNAALDAEFERSASQANARSLIPKKYALQKTSDLKRTVVDGENNFEIELVD